MISKMYLSCSFALASSQPCHSPSPNSALLSSLCGSTIAARGSCARWPLRSPQSSSGSEAPYPSYLHPSPLPLPHDISVPPRTSTYPLCLQCWASLVPTLAHPDFHLHCLPPNLWFLLSTSFRHVLLSAWLSLQLSLRPSSYCVAVPSVRASRATLPPRFFPCSPRRPVPPLVPPLLSSWDSSKSIVFSYCGPQIYSRTWLEAVCFLGVNPGLTGLMIP